MSCLRLAVLLLLIGATAATAQTTSGSMSGSVVDESTQAVPGATITIVNEATGEQRTALSNEVGDFMFPALVAGPYTHSRRRWTGSARSKSRGASCWPTTGSPSAPSVSGVGQLTEEVSVTARGETVASTTTSHQAVMDLKQVTNLSIRGRDPISLLKILPGVQMLPNDQETFGGSFATPVPSDPGRPRPDDLRRRHQRRRRRRRRQLQRRHQPGRDPGSERPDEHLHRRVRLEGRRAGELHHQARRNRVPRHGLHLPAVHRPERHAVLQPYRPHPEAGVPLLDDRRQPRWSHSAHSEAERRTDRSCSSSTRWTTRG